jgi:Spy/CpxP family protein refolding chaperone
MRTLIAVVVLVMSGYVSRPDAADDKPDLRGALAERLQDLNLTDEQEARIADVRKEFRPRVQGAVKEVAALVTEEVEKVRGILTPEQKTQLAALKEERRERRAERLSEMLAHLEELDLTEAEMARFADIRKEFQPRMVKAFEGLKGLLSDDQRKAREEALKAGKSRREILAAFNLTDDQKQKVEAVGKEIRNLLRDELEKMRDVFTEMQKEKLQEFKDESRDRVRDSAAHRIANLKDLNLTEEQKNRIGEVRKEYRARIHEAGNKLRGTVREEVEAILAILKG